jgi:protein phosphatase 2C
LQVLDAVRLSIDHKPNLAAESSRIKASGGQVRQIHGCWRVSCIGAATLLAISRALGDRDLKDCTTQPLVISTPYVASVELTPRDQFVILATDGLWDVVDDQAAVRLAADAARRAPPPTESGGGGARHTGAAEAAAEALLKRASELGSTDNITVLVAMFDWS